MSGVAVRVEDVWRTYDGRVTALAGVALDIAAGEFVVVTGPSGSGKSTLLQVMGSLDRPDRGHVLVDGRPVPTGRAAIGFRRHMVGFVFQLHHLLPMVSAQVNVEVPLLAAGVHREERRRRARALLEEVGLGHRLSHLPSQLSGGERQKVAVARAVVHGPRLLLADEPTGALDSAATERLLDLLATLRERHGMTLVVVSHDDAVAERADRVVHVVDGRVAASHGGRRVIALVLAHVARRRGRTLLTASGIAVGVAAIVALLALTSGLERRAGELVNLGRADLGIFQRNAADLTTSVLPLSLVERLRARPDVADATPAQLIVEGIPGDPSAITFGGDPDGFLADRLVMTAGRRSFGPHDVLIGDALARRLTQGPGDTLQIKGRDFRIAGVYHTGISFEDGGAIVDLRVAQRLAGRRADEATTIAVVLAPHVTASDAEDALRRDLPSVNVIADPEEAARAGANSLLITKAMPLIVALALIVGGLFVANTMVMAVLERQGEIALLSAVGWSPAQVGALVMAEAILVSVAGAVAGLVLGIAAAEALPRTLGLLDFIEPHLTAWGLGRGVLVGVAIGVLGGLYPTWRASRMDPAGVLARA